MLHGSQCTDCRQEEVAYYLHRGDSVPPLPIRRHLAQEHFVLYLALFGRGCIKVGISAIWRWRQRLLEQGAIAGWVVASGHVPEVLEAERTSQKQCGLHDRILWTRKLTLLSDIPSAAEAHASLAERLGEVQEIADRLGLTQVHDSLAYNVPRYGIGDLSAHGSIGLVGSLDVGDVLAGRIVCIYGQMLVVRSGGETYALPGSVMSGHSVRVGSRLQSSRLEGRVKAVPVSIGQERLWQEIA
jgi:Protein of unknown function (DUF2797)